jgi:hypothetical protein
VRLLHVNEELARSEAARVALERKAAEQAAENERLLEVHALHRFVVACMHACMRACMQAYQAYIWYCVIFIVWGCRRCRT